MNDAVNISGYKQEYERLLKPLMRIAFGVALHLTRNRDDAEDLVQETAIQAYRAFPTFQPGSHFKAWFLRILTNLFLNKVRKKQREPEIASLNDAPDLYLYTQVTLSGWTKGNEDPAKQLMERIGTEQMVAAIAALPEEFRVCAALYFEEELSYQEIAEILDCPLGTVRSRLHRGRKILQRTLWELVQETPPGDVLPQTKGGN